MSKMFLIFITISFINTANASRKKFGCDILTTGYIINKGVKSGEKSKLGYPLIVMVFQKSILMKVNMR